MIDAQAQRIAELCLEDVENNEDGTYQFNSRCGVCFADLRHCFATPEVVDQGYCSDDCILAAGFYPCDNCERWTYFSDLYNTPYTIPDTCCYLCAEMDQDSDTDENNRPMRYTLLYSESEKRQKVRNIIIDVKARREMLQSRGEEKC